MELQTKAGTLKGGRDSAHMVLQCLTTMMMIMMMMLIVIMVMLVVIMVM